MNVFTMAHRITHRVLCQGSFLEMTQIYHESVCRPEFWFKKGIDIIQSNAMNFRRLRSSIFSRWIVMADVISYSEHLHHQQSFINASLHQWLLIIISMFSRISSFFFSFVMSQWEENLQCFTLLFASIYKTRIVF